MTLNDLLTGVAAIFCALFIGGIFYEPMLIAACIFACVIGLAGILGVLFYAISTRDK